MYSNTLTLGIVLVILMSFFVSIIDMTYPLIAKSRFDEICRQYAILVAAEGDLSEEEIFILEEELQDLGIQDVNVDLQYQAPLKFNDDIKFSVTGSIKNSMTRMLFYREEVTLPCAYNIRLSYRKYQN